MLEVSDKKAGRPLRCHQQVLNKRIRSSQGTRRAHTKRMPCQPEAGQ